MQFALEAVLDPASGKYYWQVQDPSDRTKTLFRSDAVYPTLESAEYDAVRIFKEKFDEMKKADKVGKPKP